MRARFLLVPAVATLAASPLRSNEHDLPYWWHGQAGQDHTVASLFGHERSISGAKLPIHRSKLFFVDLAANLPVRLSNTRALERDHGWNGLCIDGNRALVAELTRRRRCRAVHALLGTAANMTFSGRSSSGFGAAVRCRGAGAQCQPTTSLASILDQHGAPRTIHYLSLDLEGMENHVLQSFPHERYTFYAMTIERPGRAVTKWLLPQRGFRYAFDHGTFGDQLWIHESIPGGFDSALERARASYARWVAAMSSPDWSHRSGRTARALQNICGIPAEWVEHGVPSAPHARCAGKNESCAGVHELDQGRDCSCRGVC